MMGNELLLLSILILYALGALGALLFQGRVLCWWSHLCPLLAGVLSAWMGINGLWHPEAWTVGWDGSFPQLHWALRLDPLAALFLVVLGLLGAAASLFATGYVAHLAAHGRGIKSLAAFYNAFLASMTLVVLADQALVFLLAWELMALTSYFMVVYEHDQLEHQRAGFLYFVLTHVGTALVVVLFLSLYALTGSLEFGAFRGHGPLDPGVSSALFLLALVGFGLKAGLIPLHVWLPAAHPAAPSHVSALMSGVMIKLGLYGLLRVVFEWLAPFPSWWGLLVLTLGAVSAVLGVLYAVLENDIKRLLAYSSIENVGIVLLGAGLAMSFHALGWDTLAAFALAAGLFHLLNHAAFKGLLFLGSGAVLQATGTRNLEHLGGLLKRMPQTGFLFLVGTMAIVALPPLNGFASEWMTFQALLLSLGVPNTALHLSAALGGALLALTGALALAAFVKAFGIAFLGAARSEAVARAHEVTRCMRGGMAVLGALCLTLGLWPGGALSGVSTVVAQWIASEGPSAQFGWAVALPTLGQTRLYPLGVLAFFALLAAVAYGILRALKQHGTNSVGATWDCGLSGLNPHMQYSATGFSKPIRMIFRMIYRPRREVEIEHGVSPYFKHRIHYKVQIASPFESYLYQPISQGVMWLAGQVRRLQTGSLQRYLIYVLVALLIVLWGAR